MRVVLVGGGLANSLIAFRLRDARPELELLLVERGATLGGNHVWSFHDRDLSPEQHAWVAPLVERSWPGHEVRFPELRRRLSGTYHSVTSERLHRVVGAALGGAVRLDAEVTEAVPDRVTLADGTAFDADLVIDGRGFRRTSALDFSYQKFVGRVLELEEDHDLAEPILMDATVEQRDGFRFLYTLPFGRRRLLVEETRYSSGRDLDVEEMREGISCYADSQGWRVAAAVREEQGVLPVVLGGEIDAFWRESPPGLPCSGMRAALFHPTTGYSLLEAVRLADEIARQPRPTSAALWPLIRARSARGWRRGAYFRLLNRMLFRAAVPGRRWIVMQRFYRLPERLIERFYAGRLTLGDRVRILSGRPPVPLGRAWGCLFERRARSAVADSRS
jgi:lycopene beta-cyclase